MQLIHISKTLYTMNEILTVVITIIIKVTAATNASGHHRYLYLWWHHDNQMFIANDRSHEILNYFQIC